MSEVLILKHCPFCGGEATKIFIGNDATKKRSVEIKCIVCFTKQVTGAIRNNHAWCDEVATKKWNNRVPEYKEDKPVIEYVAGFCFDYSRERLALILKNKPEWQNGCYNAIGGKIEAGEIPIDAMQREFLEETGADIWAWNLFCTYKGPGYIVYFFKAFSKEIANVRTMETEEVKVFDLTGVELSDCKVIDNLNWLIPLALDINVDKTDVFEYEVAVNLTPEPKPGNVYKNKATGVKVWIRPYNIEEVTKNLSDYEFICGEAHEDGDYSYLCGNQYCRCSD